MWFEINRMLYGGRTEWIKMLWVWTQFSAQSRFFVPFIDGVKPVGGNATIVKLDCCSIIAHGRHRAQGGYIVVHYIVHRIVCVTGCRVALSWWYIHSTWYSSWHRVAISHPDDTSAPMVEAQIVWMVQISTQMPKWSKSCFPNGPNGGRPDQTRPVWIWNHQSLEGLG